MRLFNMKKKNVILLSVVFVLAAIAGGGFVWFLNERAQIGIVQEEFSSQSSGRTAFLSQNATLFYEDFADISDWTVVSPWAATATTPINVSSARCNTCEAVKDLYRSFDLTGSTEIYLVLSTRTTIDAADGDF